MVTIQSAEPLVCMCAFSDKLRSLQRIAVFCAELRGHELGDWQVTEDLAAASCVHCGRTLRVYPSLVQPDIDGSGLECQCEHSMFHAA
jgi:hypothetical protein